MNRSIDTAENSWVDMYDNLVCNVASLPQLVHVPTLWTHSEAWIVTSVAGFTRGKMVTETSQSNPCHGCKVTDLCLPRMVGERQD
jgi:hypothetical protein